MMSVGNDLPVIAQPRLGYWTQNAGKSALQDALEVCCRPGAISFSLGLPAMELLPREQIAKACAETLSQDPSVLQYSQPANRLKEHIVSLMRMRGVECNEGEIFLTCGAQQGLRLLVSLLADRGDEVIAEETSYPGFRYIMQLCGTQVLPVATDFHTGMDVDMVESYLRRGARPKFIYGISDGHNPLGVSLSGEKRNRLVELSKSYNVPIVEDDPYGFLSYTDVTAAPLRGYSSDTVFYIGSFSKIIAPAMRLGWLIVPQRLIRYLAILKESFDLNVSSLSQHVVSYMIEEGFLEAHLGKLRREYRCRRDAMIEALSETFPVGSKWLSPDCGIYVWVQLQDRFDAVEILHSAVRNYNVVFMPGLAFTDRSTGPERSSMRLNFSYPSIESIHLGISFIASAVELYDHRYRVPRRSYSADKQRA